MKRTILYMLSVTAMALLLSGCGAGTEAAPLEAAPEVYPKEAAVSDEQVLPGEDGGSAEVEKENAADTLLTEEEIKKIALEDAGAEEQDADRIRIKLDYDDGKQEYEVEFYVDNQEYEYEIDAATGKILSKDVDYDKKKSGQAETSEEAAVSIEEAGEIALEKVPGAAKENMRIHLDHDDGRAVYEGSIIYDGVEYEFEIDAGSGSILEWEEER